MSNATVDVEIERQEEPKDRRIALRGPAHRPLPPASSAAAMERLLAATPARIGTGRTGNRYLTHSALELKADHATALDAVNSEVPHGWAEQRGWIPLETRATGREDFLLMPEHGRWLSDASRQVVVERASRGVDVQLIAGDGLSALALVKNGPAVVEAVRLRLARAGLSVGVPLFVRFARVAVQDEIGVLTAARATVLVVGERPGLGTGDSLSLYLAVNPRAGQDNAEKDCISNVRPSGFGPEDAAEQCASLLVRSFAAGGGGVRLTGGDPALRPHVGH